MLTHSDKISERIGVLVLRFARKSRKQKKNSTAIKYLLRIKLLMLLL